MLMVHRCKRCLRYCIGGDRYEHLDPESTGLMSLCLRCIPALKKQSNKNAEVAIDVRDASFIWTEPHSMRLKVKLQLKAILHDLNNMEILQRIMVEIKIGNKQCKDCQKQFQNQTWMGLVQLRQKRSGTKGGLATVESHLAKRPEIRQKVYNIDTSRNGFDFYFATVGDATAFASFLSRICPVRTKATRKLVSTDNHSNTANVKHTFVCDMVRSILTTRSKATSIIATVALTLFNDNNRYRSVRMTSSSRAKR